VSIHIFTSDIHDPWFNLATEDWIFRDMDPSGRVLFLWRNADTVVIGRHQNPWKECRLDKMEADGVRLARRQSGGGAVYHDLGNTNFTFMASKAQYDQIENFSIIIRALANLGITAERSGRNDLLVAGKKISGSAFKYGKDRSFHHGTLLINADLTRLVDYLNPQKRKLESKGIDSVRSRVANLIEFRPDLTHRMVCDAAIQSFRQTYHEQAEVVHLDKGDLEQIPSLAQYYRELSAWEWRFGKTPDFTHRLDTRFTWGEMDIHLDVHRGIIQKALIYSDSMFSELVDFLQERLCETPYVKHRVAGVIRDARAAIPELSEVIDELGVWLIGQV